VTTLTGPLGMLAAMLFQVAPKSVDFHK
jgi:hypothetical protein